MKDVGKGDQTEISAERSKASRPHSSTIIRLTEKQQVGVVLSGYINRHLEPAGTR